MKQLENVGLTHSHTHTQFAERIGKLIFMAVLLPVYGLQAQFIDPVTPDIYVSSCRSVGVENSGTSLLDYWQVSVVDGSVPSIIFYNHLTGVEDCHPLEGFNLGFTISDPDVVWDYRSNEEIYVVYIVSNAGSMNGVWAERWKMDPTNNFIYGDIGYTDPTYNIPIVAQLEPSQTALYPNIDFSPFAPEVVVVWEDLGAIVALADIQSVGLTPKYHVNSFCTGYTLDGTQPDVALGTTKIVSISYKQLNGTTNDIVVRQDDYAFISAGNSTLLCINETMIPPVVHTDLNYPRIAMPKRYINQPVPPSPFDCNITYQIETSTEQFIGTSTHKSYLYTIPGVIGCPPIAIYSNLFNWTHDMINTIGLSISNMNADLKDDPNQRPVTTYAGNLIYNAWTWNDAQNIRYSLDEVLTVGIYPYNVTYVSTTFNPSCAPTDNYIGEVYAFWQDYLVVGEAYSPMQSQNCVSTEGDGSHLAFVYYQPATSDIILKLSSNTGTPIIRTNGSGQVENFNVRHSTDTNWELVVYPNPGNGEITAKSNKPINNIIVKDYLGRVVKNLGQLGKGFEIPIELEQSGLYFVHTILENGESKVNKVIVNK